MTRPVVVAARPRPQPPLPSSPQRLVQAPRSGGRSPPAFCCSGVLSLPPPPVHKKEGLWKLHFSCFLGWLQGVCGVTRGLTLAGSTQLPDQNQGPNPERRPLAQEPAAASSLWVWPGPSVKASVVTLPGSESLRFCACARRKGRSPSLAFVMLFFLDLPSFKNKTSFCSENKRLENYDTLPLWFKIFPVPISLLNS